MRQLQFFTTAELGRMRDRTASHNHSPERDEFRRLHARRRDWGLVQRHGRRLRHLRTSSCTSRPARTPEHGRQDGGQAPAPAVVATPAVVPALAPASAVVPASVPAEQWKCSTPAACEQRRSPARNQPTRNQPARDQHVSASQKPAPPPPHPGPAVPPARPNLPPLTRAEHGIVRSPGEAATRKSSSGCDNGAKAGPHAVAADPDRPAPNRRHPRHRADQAAVPRSAGPHQDHHETVIDKPGKWQATRSTPIRTRTYHPLIAPERPAKARSP
jgi:hypothetical protein